MPRHPMRTRRGNARRAPSVAASEQPQPPRPRARRSLAPGNPDRGAVAVPTARGGPPLPTAAAAEVTVDRPPVGTSGTSGAGDFVGIGSPSRLVAGPLLSAHRPPGPASRAPSRAPSCAPSSASAMQRDAVMQAITSMQAQLAQRTPRCPAAASRLPAGGARPRLCLARRSL